MIIRTDPSDRQRWEVVAPTLQTDVALDEKEDDEDKMEVEDRGQGREEELQYYRTLAEAPFR